MADRSILFFFLLSLLLPPHLSDSGNKIRQDCSAFYCGNLGTIRFPFTTSERPECGLCLVDGCNETVQKIQLEKGERWFQVKHISQANGTVTLYDEELGKQLQSKDCKSLSNWSLPNLPFISFHFFPNLTLLKCNATVLTRFPGELRRTNCSDYNFYYPFPEPLDKLENEPFWSSLPYCSISQLPVTSISGQNDKNLFKLLTAEFSVDLRVGKDCGDCHYKGGQCLVDSKQQFYCGKEKNSNLGLKLGLGIGSLVVLVLIIFSIYFRKLLVKRNEQFSHKQLQSSYL